MARYLELAEEAMREIRACRQREDVEGKNRFHCQRCGAHFDTSVGKAKHEIYGCGAVDRQITQEVGIMSSCPRCGSLAIDPCTDPVTCFICGK
jgi:hypothetical protein